MLKVRHLSLNPLPANEEGAGTGRTSLRGAFAKMRGRARSSLAYLI